MRAAIALLLSVTACHGDPPPGEVHVATWNLKDFPQTADTPGRIAGHLAALGVDLLAAQEIGDPGAFAALANGAGLSSWVNPAETEGTGPRLGLLWRPELVSVEAAVRFAGDPAFPRPAIRARVRLVDEPAAGLTLWVVHLKAGTAAADEQARLDAVAALEDALAAEVEDEDVLAIGDFNEAAGDPRAAEVFAPFLEAPAAYAHLTWPLAQAGTVTFLPAGIMLDHAVATTALAEELGDRAPEVPALEQGVTDYTTVVSDHRPVLLRIDLTP